MDRNAVIVQSLSFSYPDSSQELFSDVDIHLRPGWTGIVGANGVGKSTLLRLISGDLVPRSGAVAVHGPVELVEQRTDHAPDELDELLWAGEAAAGRLRSMLGIGDDWPWRWESLSHGERKRAQLAVALWHESAVLLLDEPGNHLDRSSRRRIIDALRRYRGVGVIVSHDREMLDTLCDACLFVRGAGAVRLRPGGVTDALAEEDRERASARKAARDIRREEERLGAEYQRRREEASRQRRKRSKRDLASGDRDGRARIGLAILTGKDGQAGRLQSQMEGRLRDLAHRRDDAQEVAADVAAGRAKQGITVTGRTSRRDTLLATPAVQLPLGDGRYLDVPAVALRGDDRVGLSGPNGGGKSTLLTHLLARSTESSVGAPSLLYMPQELTGAAGADLLTRCRALAPALRGAVLSRFSRLGSDPDRLLDSSELSPGEARKVMLALALESEPELIVLDEPTNHLDLDSIRVLEEALTGYRGALLLVSHDERFLSALCTVRWEIHPSTGDSAGTSLRIAGSE